MAKIKERFNESYLNSNLFEAIRHLNKVIDALSPDEKVLIAKIQSINNEILSIEI